MTSIKRWLMLWFIFVGYLFFGAFIFYSIERRYEEYNRVDVNFEELDIEKLLTKYYTWTNGKAHQHLLRRLRNHCNVNASSSEEEVDDDDDVDVEEEFQWTFYNSFFFALTTLSTIGYGNLHPTSGLGRMLVIVYSLIGIPLNGIVLAQLGEFFASTFLRAHQQYKKRRFETRFVLLVDIATYLLPGIVLFIFLPSGIFVYFEGWTWEESIYFAYVTLTTIGYGDFVAGQLTKDKWYGMYKVVLLFWIMFGLGYLVMILGFISRAMRCKKMARLERKLAQNLKHTHSKILNEFNRDVTYIRRMLNELYLLKFKPVYQDEKPSREPLIPTHSQSMPNLAAWPVLEKIPKPEICSSSEDEEETRIQFEKQRMKRRKALSENLFKRSDLRVRSETDLTKIDRKATFDNAAYVESQELMARVVDAYKTTYSGAPSTKSSDFSDNETERHPTRKVSRFEKELQGIHGFTNEEILSSECSEKDWEMIKHDKMSTYSEQWTWSAGENNDNKIFKFKQDRRLYTITQDQREKRRSLQLPSVQSIRRMSAAALNFLTPSKYGFRGNTTKEVDHKDVEMAKPKDAAGRRTGRLMCPRKLYKKRYSLYDPEYENVYECINNLTHTRMKEANAFTALKNQIGNLDRAGSVSPVLEQTSISDFLLIVNSLSANAATQEQQKSSRGDSPLFSLFQNLPQPEMKAAESKGRRYSLAVPQTQPFCFTRNKSFSNNTRRLSPVPRPTRMRTPSVSTTLSIPQMRRIRSQSISSTKVENNTQPSLPVIPSSRKIRRFSVKPVTLGATTPEIVISGPSREGSIEKKRISK